MYRIAIIGGFGLGNFGDDWLLEKALDIFLEKFSSFELCIVAPNSPLINKHYRDVLVVDSAESVVVRNRVYAGGTQFYYYASEQGKVIRDSFKKDVFTMLRPVLLWMRIMNKFRNDYYWNIGMGPFEQREGQAFLRRKTKQISKSKFISFRDEYSRDFIAGSSVLGADICWSSEFEEVKEELNYKYDLILILRSWSHSEGFSKESAQRTVDELKRQGKSVAVVFFSNLRDDMQIEGVENFAWEFKNHDFDMYLRELSAILRLGRVVVSARYHGLILASILGLQRIASFNIDPKLRNLSDALGFPTVNDYTDISRILDLISMNVEFQDYREKALFLKHRSRLVEQKLLSVL